MKGRSLGRGLWASGIGLAVAGITLFIALAAGWYPPTDEIQVDGTVLWFTAGLSLVTGIVSGVAPALRSFAVSLTASLKAGAQGALRGRITASATSWWSRKRRWRSSCWSGRVSG